MNYVAAVNCDSSRNYDGSFSFSMRMSSLSGGFTITMRSLCIEDLGSATREWKFISGIRDIQYDHIR